MSAPRDMDLIRRKLLYHPHDARFDHDGNIYPAQSVAIGEVSFLKYVG